MATVEVCGRQGITLRDHRDDSNHLEDTDSSNSGKFQALYSNFNVMLVTLL